MDEDQITDPVEEEEEKKSPEPGDLVDDIDLEGLEEEEDEDDA